MSKLLIITVLISLLLMFLNAKENNHEKNSLRNKFLKYHVIIKIIVLKLI